MLKLHLISFQFFLIIFSLLTENILSCKAIITEEILYEEAVKEKLNKDSKFKTVFENEKAALFISKTVVFELLKNFLTIRKFNMNDIYGIIENHLLNYFPHIKDNEIVFKNESRELLEAVYIKNYVPVKTFVDDFNKTFNLLDQFGLLKNSFENLLQEIELKNSSYLEFINYNKQNAYNNNYDDIYSYSDIYDNAKEANYNLEKNFINILNFNHEIKNFKDNFEKGVNTFKKNLLSNIINSSILIKLVSVINEEINNMRKQISIKSNLLNIKFNHGGHKTDIREIENNLDFHDLSHLNNSVIKIEDVMMEYDDFLRIENSLMNDEKESYMFYNKMISLIEKYMLWLKNQNPYSYCQRKDIKAVLDVILKILDKLINSFEKKYEDLSNIYKKLYEELIKLFYDNAYNLNSNSYISTWESFINFQGLSYSDGSKKVIIYINYIKGIVSSFKMKNTHLKGESYSFLNKIISSLNMLKEKLLVKYTNFDKLITLPNNIQIIKKDLEHYGIMFKNKIEEFKNIMSLYNVSRNVLDTEIYEIIYIISNIIYKDNLIAEFKHIRKIWKNYIKNNSLKHFNIDEKEKICLKFFPPNLGLDETSKVEYNNVDKNSLNSKYFTFIHNKVLNECNNLANENEARKYYSKVFRKIDITIALVNSDRKSLKSKYNDKRERILYLIKIKNDSIKKSKSVSDEIMEHEKYIIHIMSELFTNKIEIDKELKFENLKHRTVLKEDSLTYFYFVENFITKHFLTMNKWKKFINEKRKIIPSNLIHKIENV